MGGRPEVQSMSESDINSHYVAIDTPPEIAEAYPLEALFSAIRSYNPQFEEDLISRAYGLAATAHHGCLRKSGEPYFSHVYQVAQLLAQLKMDTGTIAAGLLHDVVEDTPVSAEQLEKEFGSDIRSMVQGVTKIGTFKFRDKESQNAENFRNLVLASAKDIRVILIKLADRLHNMRTLHHQPPEKQGRIARETLEIFAPFANRLGISWMKGELEDLSFRYTNPEAHEYISRRISQSTDEQKALLERLINTIYTRLTEVGIRAEISGRPKTLYSIHQKMVNKKLTFDEILDFLAVRVLVEKDYECYTVLGIIHSLWRPVQDRFKDYIGNPKPNLYQSLHTTVTALDNGSHPLEVQIRTYEMHRIAEEGVAAHWVYKERHKGVVDNTRRIYAFIRQFAEMDQSVTDVREFFKESISNILSDSVYLLTPKGDARCLPKGSTVIDFAYDIHSELGNHCVGARVNGKFVPLKQQLKHGDVVEIISQKNQTPRADWLKYVKTYKARTKIQHYIKQQEREYNIQFGQEIFQEEVQKLDGDLKAILKHEALPKVLEKFSCQNIEDLYALLGAGGVKFSRLVPRLRSFSLIPDEKPVLVEKAPKLDTTEEKESITVGGLSDVMVRFAKCCLPVHGDKVVGVVSSGKGISIHRNDCVNVSAEGVDRSRVVRVDWDSGKKRRNYLTRIRVICENRMGIAADINQAISNTGTNMTSSKIEALRDKAAMGEFTLMVTDLAQLTSVINAIRRVKGVTDVQRR